jgi:putative glutamine amidotransferase
VNGSARPVIGISCYVEQARWGAWDQPAALVPLGYVEQVQRAGGIATVLPPDPDAAVVDRLDGLVLAGGPDLDAARYGAEPHPTADPPRQPRDAAEVALYRAARDRGLPVLGICRGLQVMALAHGGSLHQHLPDIVGDDRHRRQRGTYSEHGARFAADTLIAGLLGAGEAVVNSSHHQALDDPGSLTVTGWADDGTIEVCEDPAADFVLGVQWHPEAADDPRLFDGLIAAARRYSGVT